MLDRWLDTLLETVPQPKHLVKYSTDLSAIRIGSLLVAARYGCKRHARLWAWVARDQKWRPDNRGKTIVVCKCGLDETEGFMTNGQDSMASLQGDDLILLKKMLFKHVAMTSPVSFKYEMVNKAIQQEI